MATAVLIDSTRPVTVLSPSQFRRTRRRPLRWAVSLSVVLLTTGLLVNVGEEPTDAAVGSLASPHVYPTAVGALARIAPEGDVIAVTPGSAVDGGRVAQLKVSVNDRVEAGQVVAVLDTYTRRAAVVAEAQARVEVAKAKVAQVAAGPKPEDIRAQEASISRVRAEFQSAEVELKRAAFLSRKNANSQQDLENQELKYHQGREALNQALAQLEALKAVRPADLNTSQAELAHAEAAQVVAEAELDVTQVRSPIAGRVLRIHARAGERVSERGIVDVGNTDTMHAVAEVYEQDVLKIREGQRARVRIPTLNQDLSGVVVHKDLVVSRKIILNNDPIADIDARVVEVRIRLAAIDSPKVAGLSNARAEVVIDVSGGDSQ